MTYYDCLPAEQPWSSLSAFSDAWNISDLFTIESQTLPKALQSSISTTGDAFSDEMPPYSLYDVTTTPSHTPTASGVSSENEALVSKERRSVPPPSGIIAKRKRRPSKRAATTTFIATDPDNFMQMVQEVTGVRIDGSFGARFASVTVLKPEPMRAVDGLPTLDTSAYLLSPPYAATAAPELYFDSVCSFPTLESSNV